MIAEAAELREKVKFSKYKTRLNAAKTQVKERVKFVHRLGREAFLEETVVLAQLFREMR